MSSTGAIENRLGGPLDIYPTPAWCVHRLLERMCLTLDTVAEPCVGEGSIYLAVRDVYDKYIGWPPRWVTCDIREHQRHPGCVLDYTQDFLTLDKHPDFDCVSSVITNPPYLLAEKFIRHSRYLFPNARIAMLLRVGFLGSESRVKLWNDIGVPNVYVLPNRPSFVGGRTDSSEYAWFVWPSSWGQIGRQIGRLEILKCTPKKQRLAKKGTINV